MLANLLRHPVCRHPVAHWGALVIAALSSIALGLWVAGVGQSTPNPIPTGPRPDGVYWAAVRACKRAFLNTQDQRRCSAVAWEEASSTARAISTPSFHKAAREGMYELVGWTPDRGRGGTWNTNSNNAVAWDYDSGLWAGSELAHWWQSALALRTVVRYLERTDTTGPIYQRVLERTYRLEIHHPHAVASDYFVNRYGDDTAWWGIAWLDAANYEFRYVHDTAEAAAFLRLAEHDALYLAHMPKSCGGVVWELGYPPDTVTNAEYVALMADLYSFRNAAGPFNDPARARQWLHDATSDLSWLERSGLVNLAAGKVSDRMTRSCDPSAGPLTYTEGEMADALVQMGNALHDRAYYGEAARFINFATTRSLSNMVSRNGILQEPCEPSRSMCVPGDGASAALSGGPVRRWLDRLAWKGILAQAVDDFATATGSNRYRAFLHRQATAIVNNAIRDAHSLPGKCQSPSACEFVFYWAWPLSPARPMIVTTGTQMNALDVLTGVLAHSSGGPLGVY